MGEGGTMNPSNGKDYPGIMTRGDFLICILAAMGFFIFGDGIGIPGWIIPMPDFLKKFFPEVCKNLTASKNQYCTYNSDSLTRFISSLCSAALLASVVAPKVTRVFGRKPSMLIGGILFLAGSAVNGFAHNVWMLIVGRLLLGLGTGFANQSVPDYLYEMAPDGHYGALIMVFQFIITLGILGACLLNYFMSKVQKWMRISLGCAAVPGLIFILGSFFQYMTKKLK